MAFRSPLMARTPASPHPAANGRCDNDPARVRGRRDRDRATRRAAARSHRAHAWQAAADVSTPEPATARRLDRAFSSRGAGGDPGVVEHQAGSVVDELALEAEARSAVVVALATGGIRQTSVSLLEPLDAEVGGAHVRGGCGGLVSDGEAEPMDGKRGGERRRLEVDVHAAVELREVPPVNLPAAAAVGSHD